jgi:hypothetical protein
LSYSGPDNGSASANGSCSDAAGNTASASFAFQYDATPPSVTATADRGADANGWYNHALSVSFAGSDALSGGVTCDSSVHYTGPDGAAAQVSGGCIDAAGNKGTASASFKYDATPPTVSATPSRPADANGWYNHALGVSFAGEDALSGGVTCSPALSYSGPDNAAATAGGSCSDLAGNTGTASLSFQYDATPPSVTATPDRGADANGWYNHALTVSFAGQDGVSGNVTCVAPTTYSGPDSAAAQVSGSCSDAAGNSGTASLSFKYDATPPSVTATLGRSPDANGWFNHPLLVSFAGEDSLSGGVTCDPTVHYTGPDGATATQSGTCTDAAGNKGTAGATFKYDATPPTVTPAPSRPADANDWYNHALSIGWVGTDALSGGVTCSDPTAYAGPDNAAALASGNCSDAAGNTASASFAFKYDATPPEVTATANRGPDANGWYNHALSVSFAGNDALSGKVVCDAPATFSGPDSATAQVNGGCTDAAGNKGTASLGLKYDATPPTVTAAPSRPTDGHGWYNHALSIGWVGNDALSGLASCSAPTAYSGPDNGSALASGSCSDLAGNTAAASFAFQYDATPPTVSATADRGADANGWYNHALSVSFAGSDALSGDVTCDPAVDYSGPDGAAAQVSGGCSDAAGNRGTAGLGFKYDATPPEVTATASRPADANGWYNHALGVSFAGEDALSGGVTCSPALSYSGPDNAAATAGGSCSDLAGNTGTASLGFKYDATPPTVSATPDRGADANGWYNHALTVSFVGQDGVSGTGACTPAAVYSGPDTSSTSLGGSCSDQAGNSAQASLSFKYDSTPPAVTATVARAADVNGWYNHPLAVSFSGSDSLSGGVSCDNPATYAGPDGATATQSGTCTDAAGNKGTAGATFKYDATPPTVSPTPGRSPDANGWYNHPVSIAFSGQDATSGGVTCNGSANYAGPDSAKVQFSAKCTDQAGNEGSGSLEIKYDATPPTVTASADRQPDRRDYYHRPVTVTFGATDAMSGSGACTPPVTYSGPGTFVGAKVEGTCADLAGNQSKASLVIKYVLSRVMPYMVR